MEDTNLVLSCPKNSIQRVRDFLRANHCSNDSLEVSQHKGTTNVLVPVAVGKTTEELHKMIESESVLAELLSAEQLKVVLPVALHNTQVLSVPLSQLAHKTKGKKPSDSIGVSQVRDFLW